jgi:hypothetical protein
MLSSFVHILIVTPVLFTWLRERELKLAPPISASRSRRVRSNWVAQPAK